MCDEMVVDAALYIRLGCRCVLHYHCLVQYLHHKINDRLTMSLFGISCPFGSSCKSHITIQEVTDESKIYYITMADLDNIVDYCALQHPDLMRYLAASGCEKLSHEKVASLRQWIEDAKNIKNVPGIDENNLYVLATTKACPSCKFPSTHYHHHQCHHISPARPPKRGGCINCHVEYCYKCLSTEAENRRLRGNSSSCKCGCWSNFCTTIANKADVDCWIAVKHGIPYDKRCGCVICTDCRYQSPCDLCDETCPVCRGLLEPSPLEATKDLSQLLPEMYGRTIRGTTVPVAPPRVQAATVPVAPPRVQAATVPVAPPRVQAANNRDDLYIQTRDMELWTTRGLMGMMSYACGCMLLTYKFVIVLTNHIPFLGNIYITFTCNSVVLCWALYLYQCNEASGGRRMNDTFSLQFLGLMKTFGIFLLAAASSMVSWRRDYYFFAWPWSIIEDSWLLLLTEMTPIDRDGWFLALPLLLCRITFTYLILGQLCVLIIGQEKSSSDFSLLITLILVHVATVAISRCRRQLSSIRSTQLRERHLNESYSWVFIYSLLLSSIGLGFILSQPLFSPPLCIIIVTVGAMVLYGNPLNSTVELVLLSSGFFRMAISCDHVRHYLYTHHLQHYSMLTAWVIHILDIVACSGMVYYAKEKGAGTVVVMLHFVGFKILDFMRCVYEFEISRILRGIFGFFFSVLGSLFRYAISCGFWGIVIAAVTMLVFTCCLGKSLGLRPGSRR